MHQFVVRCFQLTVSRTANLPQASWVGGPTGPEPQPGVLSVGAALGGASQSLSWFHGNCDHLSASPMERFTGGRPVQILDLQPHSLDKPLHLAKRIPSLRRAVSRIFDII